MKYITYNKLLRWPFYCLFVVCNNFVLWFVFRFHIERFYSIRLNENILLFEPQQCTISVNVMWHSLLIQPETKFDFHSFLLRRTRTKQKCFSGIKEKKKEKENKEKQNNLLLSPEKYKLSFNFMLFLCSKLDSHAFNGTHLWFCQLLFRNASHKHNTKYREKKLHWKERRKKQKREKVISAILFNYHFSIKKLWRFMRNFPFSL